MDDIVLMADSTEEAADLKRAVERASSNIDLNMNESKTNIWLKMWSLETFKVSLESTSEKTENFNYLGSRKGSTE